MRWMLVAGLAGCGAGQGGTDAGTTPTTGPAADWPRDWAAFEDEVLELVNQRRFVGGTCGDEAMPGGSPALEMDGVLRGVARLHSRDMADRDFFDHVSPDGDDPFDRMADAGFDGALPWGENIALGAPTPEVVVDGWMNSPPHCVNMLLADFEVIGIGLFVDPDQMGGFWWTQDFAGSH